MLYGRVRGAEVTAGDEEISVDAGLVVNATGPWVDHLRRLEDPKAATSVRLSRGAHVVVPANREWSAALTIPQDGVRVTFAVPWYGMFLLGTTDSPYEGDPAAVSVEPTDAEQILAEASVALDRTLIDPDGVRASYAGLRALPLGDEDSASVRRETVFTRSPGGMLNVAAGSSRPTAESRFRRSIVSEPSWGFTGSTSSPGRFPAPWGSTGCRYRMTSIPMCARTCSTSTEAAPPMFWRARGMIPRCSSGCTRTAPTSRPRFRTLVARMGPERG